MSGVSKISHQGKEVMYIDYRECKSDEEMIVILKEAQALVIKENKPYLQLTDMRGVSATKVYMDAVKKVAKETPKIALKRAILGVDSVARRILLRAYSLVVGGAGIKPFDDREEALDWLTKD